MPKIAASRPKTVAPKKPAAPAKAKTEKKTERAEDRSAREMREFRAALDKKNGVTNDPVRERRELKARLDAMAGRTSDPAKKVLVGGIGSDSSTREQKELRAELNRVFVGGRGSDRNPISFTDSNVGGGRNS